MADSFHGHKFFYYTPKSQKKKAEDTPVFELNSLRCLSSALEGETAAVCILIPIINCIAAVSLLRKDRTGDYASKLVG